MKKPRPYVLDQTAPCPLCGAKALHGGELTFKRRGAKWHGPYVEFECGLFVVQPGAGRKNAGAMEVWNPCSALGVKGSRVMDLAPGDYEIHDVKPAQQLELTYEPA